MEVVLREALATGGVAGPVATVDAPDAPFAHAAVEAGAQRVTVFRDLAGAALAPPLADGALDGAWASGAGLIIGELPKSLAELDEIAAAVADRADAGVRLILGARERHLVHSMNGVLETHFGEVRASLGRRKARALVATRPLPGRGAPYPRCATLQLPGGGLCEVRAHGGAFAGPRLDLGTRVLLEALAADPALIGAGAGGGPIAEPRTSPVAIDLGCGTGVLATVFARAHPGWRVIATDRSWAAAASARATAAANDVDIEVVQADAGHGLPPAGAELILLNPPFHEGHRVDPALANRLFDAAARLLRPGGVCLTVFNSSLHHRQQLERRVGPTTQCRRTPKFTVTRSQRREERSR